MNANKRFRICKKMYIVYFRQLLQLQDKLFLVFFNSNKTNKSEMPSSDEQSRQNIPTTKQQLIVMLKQQLEKVEDQISDMQQTLDNERQKRKQLTSQLQQKQQKIQQLLENQTKTLGDKVHQGIYTTIEAANKIRADAEALKLALSEENSTLNQKITHKDSKIILNTKKVSALEQKKTDLIRKEQNLVDKKQETRKKLQMMRRQHERVERQELELRTHIENLKKFRLYLNKNLESGLKNLNPPIANKVPRAKQPITEDNDNFWN